MKTPSLADPTPPPLADLLRSLGLGNRLTVTFAEFAKLNGRGRGYAYRQVKEGRLRAIEGDGLLRIPIAEVIRWATGRDFTATK